MKGPSNSTTRVLSKTRSVPWRSAQQAARIARWAAYILIVASVTFGVTGCASGSATPPPPPTPTPTPNPSPTVSSIFPPAKPAGALAFTLSVNGSNFIQASQVRWGGSSRTTTFVSSSQLQAQIEAADIATAGTEAVTVVTPAPGGGSSNAATFTIATADIAFSSERALDGSNSANTNSTVNIWVMNADGSQVKPLTQLTAPGAHSGLGSPAVWSPDGTKIAFDATRALDGTNSVGTDNIWIMNADGSNAHPLTELAASGADSIEAAWSPDGSKIAFESKRALDGSNNANLTDNIWVMNADGSNAHPLTQLTASGAVSFSPVWSPDGSKIAFTSLRALDGSNGNGSAFNIWVMNADSSNAHPLTQLTANGASSFLPTWSPDSNKVVFLSQRALDGSNNVNTNGTENIWVMNTDGSQVKPLTQLTALQADSGEFSAVWSPDGSKIAFDSARALDGSNNGNQVFNIWVMNADGSNAHALTQLTGSLINPPHSFKPVWSPDGSKIVFQSSRALDGSNNINTNFVRNIWMINADGSNAHPLTQLTATGSSSFNPSQGMNSSTNAAF